MFKYAVCDQVAKGYVIRQFIHISRVKNAAYHRIEDLINAAASFNARPVLIVDPSRIRPSS